MPAFDISEYKERIGRTKERMNQEGVEIIFASNPANMNYLTGYDGKSYYLPQLIMVKIDEEEPIWIGRAQDVNGAKITTWLKEENIIGYSDDYVQSPVKHPMNFVADFLKSKGWDKKTIGVEMDLAFFLARCLTELQASLPNAVIKDTTLLVNMVRQIKSDAEISFMKRAGQIIENAMEAGIESIKVGARQCDAAANVYYALIHGTNEFGGDYPTGPPTFLIGEDFSEFALRVPSVFYFIGTGNEEKETTYPHHHPRFNIDEDTLSTGVEMHVRTALAYLSSKTKDN